MKLIGNKQAKQQPVLEGIAATAQDPAQHVDTDETSPLRWGLWALGIGFGGFLLWAGLAPLDAGVTSPGTVVVASNRKTIQHQTGGTVERILVQEGSQVKQGDPLIQLNSTDARSQLGIAETQFISAKAVESRLLAERVGSAQISYDPSLAAYASDPRFEQAKALQNQLFATRRASLNSEIGMLNEQVAGLNEQLKGYQSLKSSRQSQSKWMGDELRGVRDLAKEGYVPKNRMFQLERNAADIDGALSETIANIGRTQNAIAETKLRVLARKQAQQKEIESQLTDVQKETQALGERITALKYTLERTDIRSPINGVVVGLTVHTVGGVITPGAHIMDVVPQGEPLIVEAQINPDTISKVNVGLPVDITFPALDRHTTPNIPGTVLTVSADRLTEQRTGVPYYLARIKVTDEGMKLIGKQQIKPGMPAAVVVKTGERSMLNYLVKPLFDRMIFAFKED